MHFLQTAGAGGQKSIKPISVAADIQGASGAENTRSANPRHGMAPTIKTQASV
jgi:hypothetical protein